MIKVIRVEQQQYDKAVVKAAKVLKKGGVVAFPTDTAYGLAARVDKDDALRKILEIKKRSPSKGLSMVVQNLDQAAEFGNVDDRVRAFWDTLMPGPYTFLLPSRPGITPLLTGAYPTVAIRCPDTAFTKLLAEEVGMPYTCTSANVAGSDPSITPSAVVADLSQLAVRPELMIEDVSYDAPEFSTIIDLTVQPYRITRIGVVPSETVRAELGSLT